ncbi:hypothetical protein ABMA27_006466 [Loxostege sticticalis]|uniref:Retrotransposon gag domain-containing protein n=1 Tax=Loxostege sticticalis TaxID=481309 RepID=A0ABR3IJ95_LOXSC
MSESKAYQDQLQIPQETELPLSEDERATSPVVDFDRKKGKKNPTHSGLNIDLNILLKFVKPYDGNRETLNSFIINCNNAYNLATEVQKHILFKYILCQLQGKAEVACSIKEFNSWEQLKDFLKTQFSERKHYSHLLTDLQECKQGQNENVSQYSLRVETCLSQLLTEISLSNTKAKELPGRTAAMEDLALHHYLMGLYPRISNIVRCRSPKTLNEAINLAISEERIQQTLYRKSPSEQSKSSNNRFNKPRPNNTQSTNSQTQSSSNPSTSGLVCRYCKFPGHSIENCRKREYNNKIKSQNFQSNNQQFRKVNFVQEQDEGHDEIDNNYSDNLNC